MDVTFKNIKSYQPVKNYIYKVFGKKDNHLLNINLEDFNFN